MSYLGARNQDYLLQAGKLGVFHAEIEYDTMQNLYCSVNPFNNSIGILVQRLRISGWYSPTRMPELTLFVENDLLRRTGWQPSSINAGPGNPYNFTSGALRPINYTQNDLRTGVEYDQEKQTDQQSVFQGRVSYHLSTFDNGQNNFLGRTAPVGANAYMTEPPSNSANYLTAEGALNLESFYKTRITGSLTYGWLSQNDYVIDSNTGTNNAGNPTSAGRFRGEAGLGATTFNAYISGVTRPSAPLTVKYSYSAYNYENNNATGQLFQAAFGDNQNLLQAEQYNYFRQAANFGVDYRVNNWMCFNVGYTWQGVSRTDAQGRSVSNIPQVGIKLLPADWLSLMANYTLTARTGHNSVNFIPEAGNDIPMTYKFYTGSLLRNNANFIAEVYPVNNVSFSFNYSIYNDNFTDSTFGIQSDRGWSAGADVSWRPHDRLAFSLGYDHQQLQVRELALIGTLLGESATIIGDEGPTLTTSDSYDTFVAKADIKLIPNKLKLTVRGSYSFATSNFHNPSMPILNENYADVRTFLTYQFNEHWAIRGGYIFQSFGMSNKYGEMWTRGITAAGVNGTQFNQMLNTLGGYYRDGTANLVQAFLQYKF